MVFRTFLILFGGAFYYLASNVADETYHALYGYSNEVEQLIDSTREQRSNSNSTGFRCAACNQCFGNVGNHN